MPSAAVVFDVNIYVMAVADRDPPLVPDRFTVPPLDSNPGLLSMCIVGQGIEDGLYSWELFVSRHILLNVIHVLKRKFGWPDDDVMDYVDVIRDLAKASGGGTLEPTSRLDPKSECGGDAEDCQILALALDANANLIVTEDTGLQHLSLWKGRVAIIGANNFSLRALDARSWARRHPPRGGSVRGRR